MIIEEPVQYVYPFNRGVLISHDMPLTTYGGDLAYRDQIVFSMDGNCSNIDFGKSKNQVVYMRERDRTHADQKFLLKGRYVMCWQSAAQAFYDLQTQT